MTRNFSKTWLVAVDMGYGHQRAAFALRHLAFQGKILTANDYPGIPRSDKTIWQETRELYELISRFKRVPVIGDLVFSIFDRFQAIKDFYPKTQGLEPPTLQLRSIYGLMETRHWGEHFIRKLQKHPLPLLTTFFVPAFMAEYWGYQGPIYLVVTDADVSRVWAPLSPSKTKIRYLVPTSIGKARLERYGVPKTNIFTTGFPLPEELLGKNFAIAKENLKKRLSHLDPKHRYLSRYGDVVRRYLGGLPSTRARTEPVTILFAIGGAGAQKEIGEEIVVSLAPLLKEKRVRLCLAVGTHLDIGEHFERLIGKHKLSSLKGKTLWILLSRKKETYFKEFHKMLRVSDILWSKPSELVFYSALGIPMIIAPPIGSQEIQNRRWLLQKGAGIDELNPSLTHEWLPDFISSGDLAEAAMEGFVELEKEGTSNITKIVTAANDQ